jgi:serine/threonine-protein kinase
VLIGIIVVAILAGAGYLLAQGLLGNNDDSKDPFPVANVVGFTQEHATQELEDAGLEVDPKFKVSEAKPGRVIEQDPVPGTIVDPGSTVTIFIAKAPPPVVVPTFTGLPLGDAQTLATENHLVLVPTEGQSDTVPVGSVISQDPQPGEEVDQGSECRSSCRRPPLRWP